MLFQSGIVNRQRAGGLIETSLPRQRYGVRPNAVRNRCAGMGARAAPALETSTNSFKAERTLGLRGFHQPSSVGIVRGLTVLNPVRSSHAALPKGHPLRSVRSF